MSYSSNSPSSWQMGVMEFICLPMETSRRWERALLPQCKQQAAFCLSLEEDPSAGVSITPLFVTLLHQYIFLEAERGSQAPCAQTNQQVSPGGDVHGTHRSLCAQQLGEEASAGIRPLMWDQAPQTPSVLPGKA